MYLFTCLCYVYNIVFKSFILEVYLALAIAEAGSKDTCDWPLSLHWEIERLGKLNLFMLVTCVLCCGSVNGPQEG